jgi:hypothetical protein
MVISMRALLLIPVAALTLAAAPIPAPPPHPQAFLAPAPAAKKDAADEAIDRGLEYLRTSQAKNGSWGNPGANPWGGGGGFGGRPQPAATSGDIAITSLAVMAFLSAGHVPGEGHYGAVVERGIDWVLSQQQADGKLVSAGQPIEMYHHGIATLMLAEVVGLVPAASADKLRAALEKAVKVILKAQRDGSGFGMAKHAGGWRYQVTPNGQFGADADLSVTGWQLMALRAAKNVGCDVPATAITDAVGYVERCYDERKKNGVFDYQPGGVQPTTPCTGVGVLCLELSGKEYHLCDKALQGGGYLLKNPLSSNAGHFYYGVYYVSQALFQLGGNYWESFRPKLHDLLLNQARPGSDGGWGGDGRVDGATYGSAYATAMAILALTVEYRYLPIYQRFEEPLERDGKE